MLYNRSNKGKEGRRWFFYLRLFLLCLILVFLTHPFWLPPVLEFTLPRVLDAKVSSIERRGFDKMVVRSFSFQASPSINVEVDHAELPSLFAWVGWKLMPESFSGMGKIELGEVVVKVSSSTQEPDNTTTKTPNEIFKQISQTRQTVSQYLESVSAKSLRIEMGDKVYSFHQIAYGNERLAIDDYDLGIVEGKVFLLDLGSEEIFPAQLTSRVLVDGSTFEILGNFKAQENLNYRGEVKLEGPPGRIITTVEIGGDRWMPRTFTTRSEKIDLSLLPYFKADIPLGPIEFALDYQLGDWQITAGNLEAPQEGNEDNDPDLQLNISASGKDFHGTLETVHLEASDVLAELSNPVNFTLYPFSIDEAASFKWSVQKSIIIAGHPLEQTNGVISLTPEGDELDLFSWKGKTELKLAELPAVNLQGSGEFDRDMVKGEVRANSSDGLLSVLIQGGYAYQKQELLEVESSGKVASSFIEPFIGDNITFSKAEWSFRINGPPSFQSLSVAQANVADLKLQKLKPMDVSLEVKALRGETGSLDIRLQTEAGELSLAGNYQRNGQRWSVQSSGNLKTRLGPPWGVDMFNVTYGENLIEMALRGAAIEGGADLDLSFIYGKNRFQAELDSLHLNGYLGSVFLEEEIEGEIDKLNLSVATGKGGILKGKLFITAVRKVLDVENPFRINSAFSFGERLRVERANIVSDEKVLLRAEGNIPVQFTYENGTPGFILNDSDDLVLNVTSGDLDQLSELLNANVGVSWKSGELKFVAKGTFAEPVLQFNGAIDQLKIDDRLLKGGLAIDSVKLSGNWDDNRLMIASFSGALGGQEFKLNGDVEWPSSWLIRRPANEEWLEALDTARFDLVSEQFNLAALPTVWPDVPIRTGTAVLNVQMRKGKQLNGRVEINDASSVAFGDGERVSRLNAELSFDKSKVKIETGSLYFRNRPVTIQGEVNVMDWPEGMIDLEFSSDNFPLVRKEQLILRANIKGSLKKSEGGTAAIDGNIQLVNSVFMQDLTQFARPGVKGGGFSTPIFSIKAEPFNDWNLDVAIQGKNFLRIESPFFRGLSSADFNLTGTMQDPIITGELRLNESEIRFPFGDLDVQTGVVSLSAERSQPQLNIVAQGDSLGYTVDLHVEGTASSPQLIFSSSPPLPPEEILLMLTSGTVPKDDSFRDNSNSRATQLAGYLGGSLLTRFSDTMGKSDSWTDRIRFEYGTEVTESGQDAFRVEFIISDDWTLYGEYDRFDAYNVNLKWKFFELE